MMLKSTKYQYSMRLDLPLNTAYFFSASRYQLTRHPPCSVHPPPVSIVAYFGTICAKENTIRGIDPLYGGAIPWKGTPGTARNRDDDENGGKEGRMIIATTEEIAGHRVVETMSEVAAYGTAVVVEQEG
jgi:hypothetical protein